MHTDPEQATLHDAAYEPCRSEIRALLKDFFKEIPEAPCNIDTKEACEKILVKIQDKLIACGTLFQTDQEVWEIKNLFTKGYAEHAEITTKIIKMLTKKARNSGCRKLRHSFPAYWELTAELLSNMGFVPVNSNEDLLTVELSLEA